MVDLYKVKQIKNNLVFHGRARIDTFDLQELADYAEIALTLGDEIYLNLHTIEDESGYAQNRVKALHREIAECRATIEANDDLPESFKLWFGESLAKMKELTDNIDSDLSEIDEATEEIKISANKF